MSNIKAYLKYDTYEQELILSLEHRCNLRLSTSLSETAISLAASLPALATRNALTGEPAANACSSSITTGTARLFESYDTALMAFIILPLSVKKTLIITPLFSWVFSSVHLFPIIPS